MRLTCKNRHWWHSQFTDCICPRCGERPLEYVPWCSRQKKCQKLTEDQVVFIRKELDRGGRGVGSWLAELFGVTRQTISLIKAWRVYKAYRYCHK